MCNKKGRIKRGSVILRCQAVSSGNRMASFFVSPGQQSMAVRLSAKERFDTLSVFQKTRFFSKNTFLENIHMILFYRLARFWSKVRIPPIGPFCPTNRHFLPICRWVEKWSICRGQNLAYWRNLTFSKIVSNRKKDIFIGVGFSDY